VGRYLFPEVAERPSFILSAEHIQADAFAPPSRFRALISLSRTEFPEETYSTRTRLVTASLKVPVYETILIYREGKLPYVIILLGMPMH